MSFSFERFSATRRLILQGAGSVALFGLGGVERMPFGVLSAGRQRLVLLARAMLPEPELLLLDEPCLNLDDASRRLVLGMLERLLKLRKTETVICVAHRADDVPRGFSQTLRL